MKPIPQRFRAIILPFLSLSFATTYFVFGKEDSEHQCTLYLAPSSVEHDYVLGMFAGMDYLPNTTIGTPEAAIPMIDMNLHNGVPSKMVESKFFDLQADFFWYPSVVDASNEIFLHHYKSEEVEKGGSGLSIAIPGIGSLGVQHPSTENADWDYSSVLGRTLTEKEEGSNYPGRGAFTHFFNVTLKSTKFIPKGMQIFQNIGTNNDQSSGKSLLSVDYKDVNNLTRKIGAFIEKHSNDLNENQQNELYSYLIDDVLGIVGTKGLMENEDRKDKKEIFKDILDLFPEKPNEIKNIMKVGGTFEHTHPQNIMSSSWLKENGQCMDGLQVRQSTLRFAGRGAFARRDVPSGGLISPAPLLLIDKKQWLQMYSIKFKNGRNGRRYALRNMSDNKANHQQLLLNYCFGHPESSLLLFSYGAGINFINHKSGIEGANAKIVWTKQPYHDPGLRSISVEELNMGEKGHFGLGFDIIATKDIRANEEVFLDYGTDWSEAWNSHVKGWDDKFPWKTKALDMNFAGIEKIYTEAEREEMVSQSGKDPYDHDLLTVCHLMYVPLDESDDSPRTRDNVDVFQFQDDLSGNLNLKHLHGCKILERDNVESEDGTKKELYTILFFPDKNGNVEDVVVKNVPRHALRFADAPYTSDIHSPLSFRYPIGIPDSIFPTAWRDLKNCVDN